MKLYLRRAAAIVLAVAVCVVSSDARPLPQERERSREKDPVVRIVKKVQRLLGITTNDDLPLPPPPKP